MSNCYFCIIVVVWCCVGCLSLKYEAPEFCSWSVDNNETSRVSVWCKVRTLNSDVPANRTPNTAAAVSSLSGLQAEGTQKLRVECSQVLFFESFLLAGTFQRLTQLEDLEIEHCKLAQVETGVFRGLRDLKKLSIRSHNSQWSSGRHLQLSEGSFDGLKELQSLDLSGNNMRELPERVFCPLVNLNSVNLSDNALSLLLPALLGAEPTDEEPAKKDVECEVDVIQLDVSYNSLTELPSKLSSPRRRRLQHLYVQNNNLSALRASSLAGLANLRVLNASSNQLVDLPAVPLRETCRELREVHLRDNQLHELADTFQRLEQLLVLDVARNELVNLGTSLAGLIRLIVLDLSGNAMTRLEALAFKDLYSLQILDLRDNAIASVADDTFLPLYNLHTLNLAGNRLTYIGPSMLNGLFVLNKLTLSLNLLTDIDSRAFRNCSDLKELDLSGNVLTEVPTALTELPFLRTLDLGENRITGFRNGSFKNLHQLTGLRLIDNNIGNVTSDMLWDLVGIQVLNLAKNKVQHVERGAFDRNERLEAIRLDANYLTDVNGVFTALPALLWLNLSDNHLVWFDYAFVPPSLQWLDIHSNFVEKLGNYYEIVDGFHLRTIDVSHNRLTELSALSLPNSAEIFFANNNRITSVAPGIFMEKQNLTRVDLYANELEFLDLMSLRIARGTEMDLARPLPEFYLGGNPFRCDCSMEWLQRVNNMSVGQYPRVMDLDDVICRMTHSHTEVTHIPVIEATPSHFLCRYETHCFTTCHCCDFDACDCEMTCPSNCTCYHDQAWSTNVVDCSANNHVTLPARIPMDATEIYLDGNNLRELRNHAFIGRKNMRVLYVNNSNVEYIQNRTFNGLNSLETLYLQENRIKVLRGYEFENLMHLRELYLQNNKISFIGNATFLPLRSLYMLRLDNNRLTSFAMWQLPHNPYLSQMYLANNPWSCRCRFVTHLRTWLQESSHQVLDSGATKCLQVYTEPCEFEQEDDEVSTSASLGIPRLLMNDYLPTVIATLIVVLLVIVLAVLAFAYRDNVRLWVFARYGVRLFHKTSQAGVMVREEREKLYDAYVCYSPKDEEHLVQSLAVALEPRYALCLHHRDLPARDAAIVDASEASRRVILVVTRNFLHTEWMRREFRAALHEALHQRTFKVIIIEELGGLPPEVERDPDLRPYLKTSRRIQWGDKRFWERLKYSMPEVRAENNLYRQNCTASFPGKRKDQMFQHHVEAYSRPPSEHIYSSIDSEYASMPPLHHTLHHVPPNNHEHQLHQHVVQHPNNTWRANNHEARDPPGGVQAYLV